MFIRLVKLDPPPNAISISTCSPPSGNVPVVFLRANGGAEVALQPNGSVFDPGGNLIANAQLRPTEPNDVYPIRIVFNNNFVGVATWEIRIKNSDGVDREFTWVVSDTDAGSKHPWIVAPSALDYDTLGEILIGDELTHTVSVANKGTGPLHISDTAGAVLGNGFSIVTVPADIEPNHCGDIKIKFVAPNTIGPQSQNYTINVTGGTTGNDTKSAQPGHNNQVNLKATARKLEVVMVLDGSGSMSFTPDGTGTHPPKAFSDSRWGKLEDAAELFLDEIKKFAGKGNIAIVEFPDISKSPIPDTSARVVQTKISIPSDPTNLKDALKEPNPIPKPGIGNTPIGTGIGNAMGTQADSFGEFEDGNSVDINNRWIVILSDGAHNRGAAGTSDHPTFYYGTAQTQTSFRGKKIKVFSVPYGDPLAVNWKADPKQMHDLADQSDGIFADASSPNGLNNDQVLKSFRNAITNSLAIDPSNDPGGTLTSSKPEARHIISVLPYDHRLFFVVNWDTFDAARVNVSLLTPNCELITPSVALDHPDLSYDGHSRYVMYTVEDAYLLNTADPVHPRYGNWTLIIALEITDGPIFLARPAQEDTSDSERYDFEVITQSQLKMRLKFDRPRYYSGDPIRLAAQLTLDGKPIQDANVTWTLDAPGNSLHNFLAGNKVTAAEFEKASNELSGADVTALTIKKYALTSKGVLFDFFSNQNTAVMSDPDKIGVYSATLNNTSMTGTYTFRVTALGRTADGIQFSREQQAQVYLDVRPQSDFSLVDIEYSRVIVDGQPKLQALIHTFLRDPFGNVKLIEELDPSIDLTATGGEFTGPLINNLDGSYTRTLLYEPNATPAIRLQVDNEEIIPSREITPVAELHYVDQVLEFKIGLEAEEGANQHRDPQIILGDITTRKQGDFVSLGAYGSLTVGFKGKAILAQGGDDITIFIQPDDDLRSYQVEVLPVGQKTWVMLGSSAGVTQSFSLSHVGLKRARAIRITDTSGSTNGLDFEALSTPGVSIRGVGAKKVRKQRGGDDDDDDDKDNGKDDDKDKDSESQQKVSPISHNQ